MKCETVSLADICDLLPGYAFKSKDFGNYENKVIKIADIIPPRVGMNTLNGVDLSNYNKEKLEKYIARTGDYLLAMTGATIGKIGRIYKGTAYINQRVLLFRPKECVEKDFIYYSICSKSFYNYVISSIDSETAQPNISANTIGKYKIHLPHLKIQKKISNILRTIDDKIELNNRINKNLAELLQIRYQQNFCYSTSTEKQGNLAELCDYSKDKVAVAELSLSTYYSTENMLPEKAGAVDATNLPTSARVTQCHAGDVLISNIRPYFKKIVYCHSDCGCSADVLCFTPKLFKLSAYLYSSLYADSFFDFMVAGSKGTKMPRGDKQQIMTYRVHIPTDEEVRTFNKFAIPILRQMENNRRENLRLSLLRDTLLPKLMSGELDVSELDM